MTATFDLWHKHMTKFFRNGEATFGMLLQPVLWVVLFGVGMQAMLEAGGGGLLPQSSSGGGVSGAGYIGFMLPGIITLSALAGAVAGGATLLDERLRGIVKEYLVAPIPRYSILLANALSTVTKGLFQALVIVLIGLAFGAKLAPDPASWGLALLFAGLYTLGIAGLALAVAAVVSSTLGYHGLIALDLPLLFASDAFYPLDVLPSWMGWIARLNPTTYVIDTLRRLMYGVSYAGQMPGWLSALVLVGFAALGMALATLAFRAEIRARGGAV
jgi:ABC-2 type transport system permease protein